MKLKPCLLFRGRTLMLVMSLAIGAVALAQNVKRPETYNYKRGLEAYDKNEMGEALEYFNKDVQENPKSGYPYSWIAAIRLQNEEYGRALTAVDLAIKHLPKKDVDYVMLAYSTRASVYLHLEDTVKALNDYATALRIDPKRGAIYEERAQIYYEQKKYDLADADYRKMIELNAGDVMGYMGVGRNALDQNRLDEAIEQFNHVVKMEESYASGYDFRAEAELK